MNSKEIIEALKANERPFGLMSEEMQAKAKEIDRKKFFRWAQAGSTGAWCVDNLNIVNFPNHATAYRLHPDYAEDSGVVECEVFKSGQVLHFNVPGDGNRTLEKACLYSDFIGFKYEDGGTSPLPRLYQLDGSDTQTVHYPLMGDYEVLTPTHVLFKKAEGIAKEDK